MAVRSTPPISFTDLRNEFGGGPADSLSQYVRGGPYVPNGPPQNAGIPTTPPLSLGQFYGSVNQVLKLTNRSLISSFILTSQGATIPAAPDEWNSQQIAGVGANYECLATFVSGTTPTGPFDVWTNLGSNVGWMLGGPGFQQATMTVAIGAAGANTALVSATINLEFGNPP